MTDIAIIDQRPEFLVIPHDLDFNEWWAYRLRLYELKLAKDKIEVAGPLHTMDWLFYGEGKYGENASQATAFVEKEMGWSSRTYTEYRRVWERFGPDKRFDNLGITMYQAVMGLPPATAKDLLALASENNWTREQLRKAVKHHLPDDAGPAVTRKMIEKAGVELLRNLKPAGTHYEAEEWAARELAQLLDFTLVDLEVDGDEQQTL